MGVNVETHAYLLGQLGIGDEGFGEERTFITLQRNFPKLAPMGTIIINLIVPLIVDMPQIDGSEGSTATFSLSVIARRRTFWLDVEFDAGEKP